MADCASPGESETAVKSAIVDFRFAEMHLMVNCEYLEAMSHHSDLLVLDWGSFYQRLRRQRIQTSSVSCISRKTGSPFMGRLFCLVNMAINRVALGRVRVDRIFVFGFDVIVFAFGLFLFPRRSSIFLFHHLHIDELRNGTKRLFFNFYKNRVSHVVMADYIKQYLVSELGVGEERVFVVTHPSYEYGVNADALPISPARKLFVGLSNSNDETLVRELIELEDREKIFQRNNCNVVLKSKTQLYRSDGLVVFNGSLPREQYDEYCRKATGILVLIGSEFIYRISGTMIDALSYGKTVIGTNVRCVREYRVKYPSMFRIGENAPGIVEAIVSCDGAHSATEFRRFREDSSGDSLQRQVGLLYSDHHQLR